MERLIRNLTKKYTELLPDDTAFFTPADLRKLNIPEFVIQRVEIEIYRNLNESIVPPDSDWADMTTIEVEEAWEMFINAIVAEVRMPAAHASSVFETSIADVIEMIIKPIQSIPDILFGTETELSRIEILKRCKFITVNSHLSDAVIRYMDRKGKERITRDQCYKIVKLIDNRLTQNFNSMNWAQLLQPLFLLAGPKVDSELLRIFFEDRGLKSFARRFDLTKDPVDKTAFIEILSSPDLLNEESYEAKPSTLFDLPSKKEKPDSEVESDSSAPKVRFDRAEEKEAESTDRTEEIKDSKPSDKTEEIQDSKPSKKNLKADKKKEDSLTEEGQTDDAEPEEDTLLSAFQSKHSESHHEDEPLNTGHFLYEADDEEVDEDDIKKEISEDDSEMLYNRFFPEEDEEPEEADDEIIDTSFAKRSEAEDRKTEVDKSERKGPRDEKQDQPVPKEKSKAQSEKANLLTKAERDKLSEEEVLKNIFPDEDSESGDKPIWQSFLGDEGHIEEDDIDEPAYSPFSDLDEYEEDDPIIDLSKIRDEENGNAEKLIGWMSDDENRFKNTIFSGSDRAYEQALTELNELDNWKQASKFIENEIFARNFVDMYDEDAVDFTDRMQTYFDKYKS